MSVSICSSCGRSDYNVTSFPCPAQGCDGHIKRCKKCRENEVKCACPKCGMTLP